MTPRLAALAAPLLALAAVAAPLATPSYAAGCAVAVDVPHLVYGHDGIHASATFGCAGARTGKSVTVCVEERLGDGSWFAMGCATTTEPDGVVTPASITGYVTVPVTVASVLMRAVARGSDAEGDEAAAKGAPILWVNCACVI